MERNKYNDTKCNKKKMTNWIRFYNSEKKKKEWCCFYYFYFISTQ